MSAQDLSQLSMQDLFRLEAESQTEVLTAVSSLLSATRRLATSLRLACVRPIR